MVVDWPSWWALEGQAHPSSDVRFLDAGVACDVVRPDADLSGYRLVVVPNLYLTSSETGSEEVRLEGAETVERFASGALAGEPAVTRQRFGQGSAWYLATRSDPATMRHLFDRVREEAGVGPVLPGLPDTVQARARQTENGLCYVVLNHGTTAAAVPLPAPMRDELTGTGPVTSLHLDARGVAVLRPA